MATGGHPDAELLPTPLLRRVQILALLCLLPALAPAVVSLANPGDREGWFFFYFFLILCSPFWLAFLGALVCLWGRWMRTGLRLAMGASTAAFIFFPAFAVLSSFTAHLERLWSFSIPWAVLALVPTGMLRQSARDVRGQLETRESLPAATPAAESSGAGTRPDTGLPFRKKRIGLSWGTVIALCVVANGLLFILIPTLIHSRMAVNEAGAVGSLREINTECVTYSSTYGKGFPPALENLRGNPPSSEGHYLPLDEILARGTNSGYKFRYSPGPPVDRVIQSYQVYAEPIEPGVTGVRHFFTDQSGVIRYDPKRHARANCPPIE